jgi:hypothetical protein
VLVNGSGVVANRDEIQVGQVALKRGGREEERRNSEEDCEHERMNPARMNRGTVGQEASSALETVLHAAP